MSYGCGDSILAGFFQQCPLEHCAAQGGTPQVGAVQVGAAQMGGIQVGAGQDRPLQIRAIERRVGQQCRAEPSARAMFIRRTYGHLAGAVLAFAALESVLLNLPGIDQLVGTLLGGGPLMTSA